MPDRIRGYSGGTRGAGGGRIRGSTGGTRGGSGSGSGSGGGGSFLHRLGSDAIHMVEDFGPGLYQTTKAIGYAVEGNPDPLWNLAKLSAQSFKEDFEHPLRHPLNTALDLGAFASGGAGLGLRAAAVLRVARGLEEAGAAGRGVATAGDIGKAFRKSPSQERRLLHVPGEDGSAVVQGQYKRGSLYHLGGKAIDRALERGAVRSVDLGDAALPLDRFLEKRLHKRASKWEAKAGRVKEGRMTNTALKVRRLGLKHNEAEQRALRIVAETTPYDQVLRTAYARRDDAVKQRAIADHNYDVATDPRTKRRWRQESRKWNAAVGGLDQRLEWIKDAGQYLVHKRDENGVRRPQIAPEHTHLTETLNQMRKAVNFEREPLLSGLKIMDAEGYAAARNKTARIAAGGRWISDPEARRAARAAEGQGRMAEAQVLREGRATARAAEREVTAKGQALDSAESALFRRQTTRSPEEKAALKEMNAARRVLTSTSSKRARTIPTNRALQRAILGDQFARRLEREERLLQITHERFDAGKASAGDIARAQRRVERLRDSYERYAPDRAKLRENERLRGSLEGEQAQALSEMEAHASNLRAAEKAASDEIAKLEADVHTARREHGAASREHDAAKRRRDEGLRGAQEATKAAAEAQLARAHTVEGAEGVMAGKGAIHIGDPRAPGKVNQAFRASSTGTMGHTRSTSVREKTGAARERGGEWNKTTEIVASRTEEAVKLKRFWDLVQKLAPAGSKVPRRTDDVFLWTDKPLSSERIDRAVKDFLQDQDTFVGASDDEARGMGQSIKDALLEFPSDKKHIKWDSASPEVKRRRAELERYAEEGKGVFIPRALLGDAAHRVPVKFPPPVKKFFDELQNTEKALLIYLKPSYPIAQVLSNVGMNIIQQGFLAPKNLSWAITLDKKMGAGTKSLVDAVMGQGFVHQAGLEGTGKLTRLSRDLAERMGKVTDVAPRRAAWLHEARKAGYNSPQRIRALLEDKDNFDDLVDVTQRAKEHIVDFDNLSANEKAYMRSLIFVYPWVKGSAVYLSHFLQNRPATAALLAQAGEYGARVNEEQFGDRPTYAENWVNTPWGRVDLQSVNPFATPAELGRSAVSLATLDPRSNTAASYLAPVPAALLSLATRRDDLGRPLEGPLPKAARDIFVAGTPLARFLSGTVGDRPGAVADVARAILGTERESRTYPKELRRHGGWDPLWTYVGGPLYPRGWDPGGLASAASRQGQR